MLALGRGDYWTGLALMLVLLGHARGAPSPSLQDQRLPYLIDVWESDDGLPQSSVISMVQARDGYLWLGTLAGLVRFDGIRFTVFDEGNTSGLGSSRIVHLFEDSHTNLWIGTETAGVFLAKDGLVKSLGLGAGNRDGMVVSSCEDASGAVWLFARDGRLWRYHEGETRLLLSQDQTQARNPVVIAEDSGLVWLGMDGKQIALDGTKALAGPGLPAVHVVSVGKMDFMLASREGGFWRLSDGRIQKWHRDRMIQDLGPFPWQTPVAAACEDNEGHLVVGTQGEGVFWFEEQGGFTQLSSSNGLSYDYILSLHADREGSLWVGTDGGGLNRVKQRLFNVVPETVGWVVQSVAEDADGGLWIASNGRGVGYLRGEEFKAYGPTNGLNNPNVRSIFVDNQQRVWAGSSGSFGVGLYQFQRDRFAPFPIRPGYNFPILALYQDDRQIIWVGTQGGLAQWREDEWKFYTTTNGLAGGAVRAMAGSSADELWIGTDGGGLNRLSQDRFAVFDEDTGFPSDNIASLYLDDEGVLWIGTYGGGLVRMAGDRITRYTTDHGLVSNTVGFLVEDKEENLWIGSNAGLMRVPKHVLREVAAGTAPALAGRIYGRADGLPTRECTIGSQPGALLSRNGRLWIPTIKGLVFVDPANLNQHAQPPRVTIESVSIDGQVRRSNRLHGGPPTAITVPASGERLEIQYTALNLSSPEQARFKYRLAGHESAWTEVSGSRVARYSKLPPGRFQFQLTASTEDGVWNPQEALLAVVVLPPFWRTWWFISINTALLLTLIVSAVHYFSTQRLHRQLEFLRQQEALEKERARIARDIHDQLGASLTQVNMLSEMIESDKHEPEEVAAHAKQISQTAVDTSRALDEIVWTVNPSNDTLEGLINYVFKYAQDYLAVAGLRYRFDAPDALPESVISPDLRHNVFLAAKEAITNVVRHARASEARIKLTLSADSFTLEITDNGRGLSEMDPHAASLRNGLSNMRKRMEDVGGTFAMENAPDGGAKVSLTAPLSKS